MRRSIRSRFLGEILVGIALLLVVFGALIFLTIRHALRREFDSSLKAAADVLAASVNIDEGRIEIEVNPPKAQELQGNGPRLYFEFWRQDGRVLARSESLGRESLVRFPGLTAAPAFRSVILPNQEPGRAVGIRFEPSVERNAPDRPVQVKKAAGPPTAAPTIILVVARETRTLRSQVHLLAGLLLTAGTGTMGLALGVSLVMVNRGLRPLHLLASRIAGIKTDTLAERIRFLQLPTELTPVVDKLNDLLDRLEQSFGREKSFSADAAHELRTPLAGLRSTLEVALARDRRPAEYREAIRDGLDIVHQMQGLIDKLLMLARFDAGRMTFHCETLVLRDLVDACWGAVSERAGARRLVFENELPHALTVVSDPNALGMVFLNLMENAVEYADEKGHVRVAGHAAEAAVHVVVANTGCRLTPEAVGHVFDRFWRADPSRKDTGAHCGLGLALVRRVITALGGDVNACVEDQEWFTVRIRLNGYTIEPSDAAMRGRTF